MSQLDDACREVVHQVDGALACGVVEIESGALLGVFNSSHHAPALDDAVAAADLELFRGSEVGRLERVLRAHRGLPDDGSHYFEEVHLTSAHNYHFAKTIEDGRAVMLLVTHKTSNIGLGWAQLKSVAPGVEPLLRPSATSKGDAP